MQLASDVEDAFELDEEGLKRELPSLLESLDDHVIEIVQEQPELIARVFEKMDEIDAAQLAEESPHVANQFQEFLWSTTEEFIGNDDSIREQIEVDLTVNYVATDSPMEGHLSVDSEERTIQGASDTVGNADLTIKSETDTLIDLLTGKVDPVQGFMTKQYKMDGPTSKGIKLVPILNAMADKYTSI